MKKFSKYLLLFIFAFALILGGCASNITMPDKNAKIYGNGGNVVQKGEYLYFANAFTSFSSLADASVKNGDKEYGIYRTKLSGNSYTEIDFDKNGFATEVELISSKLAGFESLGMYIVGDYLFFASPNTHQTASNQNRYDLVSFFSVKLDGTGLKELYTTFSKVETLPSSVSKISWRIYNIGDTNYLVTIENDNIVRHTISKNTLKDKTILAENVKNALLPKDILNEFDKDIYFVSDFSEIQKEDYGYTGTVLKAVNIKTNKIRTLSEVNGETVALLAHQNSNVFYSIKSSNVVKEGLYVLGQTVSALKIANTTARTNFFFMGEDKPLIFSSNNKVYMQKLTLDDNPEAANLDFELLINSSVTVLFVADDYVYYTDNLSLMRISYKNKISQTIISESFETKIIDFDSRYVYVYKTLENSQSTIKYLHRVKISTVETSEIAKFEVLGYVIEKDKEEVIKAKQAQQEE